MTLSQATLKSEMVAMDLYGNEAQAVVAWAAAWSAYFADAETNSIPIEPAALPTAEAAMAAALLGMSASDAGAGKIQAGIQAWWGAMVAAPSAFWPGCTAIAPPPGLSGIATALQSAFDSNTSGGVTEDAAYDAITGVLHPVNLGGQATFPGAPPLVFPIL